MDEFEQAHHELSRIQTIIDRHEGAMFSLRGWLFAAMAGIVAAYYTMAVSLSLRSFVIALCTLVLAFLYAELRHVILVDAVVTRAGRVERMIQEARASVKKQGWYDGPKINKTCGDAVKQLVPEWRMTLVLNLFLYVAIVIAVVVIVMLLPPLGLAEAAAW